MDQKNKQRITFTFHLSDIQIWAYVFFAFIYFLFMFSSQFYNYQKSKGAGFSDLPFQLSIIQSFAVGCNNKRDSMFRIWTAFYSSTPLSYPFIPNFHAALLISTGLTSVRYALLIPSIFIVFSFLMGLYSYVFYFTKSHLASILSLLIFTNLGGLGWTHVFDPKHRNDPRRDWIHDWGNGQSEYWFHPIMHIIIPQRSAMWSLPLCVWTLLFLSLGLQQKNRKFFALAGLMTGFLPQLQVHSYVAIAQYAIGLCIIAFPFNNKNKWREYIELWAMYAIIANIIAFPQLLPYLSRVNANKKAFVNYNPIWNAHEKRNCKFAPIILWWRGLGVFAAISLLCGWLVLDKWQITLYLPAIFVFIITNLIRYQPWELDNTKLFYAVWVPIALAVVSKYLVYLIMAPKKKLGRFIGCWVVLVFVVAMCLSAFMSTVQSMFWPTQFFSRDDYRFGLWMAENTPAKSITVFNFTHANPVHSVAGRQVFAGYSAWAYSHGLDMSRYRLYDEFFRHPLNINLFTQYNISYVVVIKNRGYDFNVQNSTDWVLAFNSDQFKVYRLNI